MSDAFVDIVFDGPPGPESCHFVEVESPPGHSVQFGTWVELGNGLWALRITAADFAAVAVAGPA